MGPDTWSLSVLNTGVRSRRVLFFSTIQFHAKSRELRWELSFWISTLDLANQDLSVKYFHNIIVNLLITIFKILREFLLYLVLYLYCICTVSIFKWLPNQSAINLASKKVLKQISYLNDKNVSFWGDLLYFWPCDFDFDVSARDSFFSS